MMLLALVLGAAGSPLADAASRSVAISGTPEVGQTLTADISGLDLLALPGVQPMEIRYWWGRCVTTFRACPSVGQSSSYVVQVDDVGAVIELSVVVNDAEGRPVIGVYELTALTSAVTAGAAVSKPALVTPPSYSGSPEAGEGIVFSDGLWSGTSPIRITATLRCASCPTSQAFRLQQDPPMTYAPMLSDVGVRIFYEVIAENVSGLAGASVSTPPITAGEAARKLFTGGFRAEGNAVVGGLLFMPGGTWQGGPVNINYLWRRCDPGGGSCIDVSSLNQMSYIVRSADAGFTIVLVARVTNQWATFEIEAPPLGPVPGGGPTGGGSTSGGTTGGGTTHGGTTGGDDASGGTTGGGSARTDGGGGAVAPLTPPKGALVRARTIVGTARRDVLRGTPLGDTLDARGGDDRIIGLGGDDTLIGGPGVDTVDAGTGRDFIRARDGIADTVSCGPGTDTVVADKLDHLTSCEKVTRA